MKQNYDTFYNLRVKLGKITSLLGFLLVVVFGNNSFGQTPVNTTHINNNGASSVLFNVQNTNAFDIIVTEIRTFVPTVGVVTPTAIYRTIPFNDLATPWDFGNVGPNLPGWITIPTVPVTGSNSIIPLVSNMSVTIPAGATYQFGISAVSISYMTLTLNAGINTFTSGGVNILTGDGISWAGAQFPSSPVNYPRGFVGGITFIPATPCISPPTAGTITASVANPVCPSVSNILSLTGGTGGTGQTHQWQSSADNITYTDIVGATLPSFNSVITTNTWYRCVVSCGGATSTSTPYQVIISNFLNCYCTSSATSATNKDIVSVSVGSLTNTSTCTSTGGPGSVTQMYSNYTNLPPVDLARGVAYPITINVDACGTTTASDVKKVYIDWNQNGLFTDPGEEVAASPAAAVGGTNVESFTFIVPLTATLGITRMRIVMFQTTIVANVNPCGTYFNGETEDYFINVAPVPTCPQPTALISQGTTTTTASLDWTPVGVETQWEVQYGLAGFALGTGTLQLVNTNSDVILTGLIPFSFYNVYVRAICGSGDTSFWTPSLSFNTFGLGSFMEQDNNCHPDGFIDISATGTAAILSADGILAIPAPFPIYFQASVVNNITISNNGVILLSSLPGTFFTGFNANTIATTAANGLYAFWDDLDDNSGNMTYETQGVSPNRRFIVQWNKKHDLFLQGATLAFQVIIEEASGRIYYQYDNAVVGSPLYDNGISATVGLAGINQDFPLSFNSATYLSQNPCTQFYYTNCPKVRNVVTNYIFPDEVSFSWTAGLLGETNWTVIYGPAGFDPLTSGTTVTTTSPSIVIANLLQNTEYCFYFYANCGPNLLSVGESVCIRTLPNCADPTGVVVSTGVDSLLTTWNWTATNLIFPVTDFILEYGQLGFTPGTGTIVSSGTNFSDTTVNSSLLPGGVYQVYVRAVCGTDSSNQILPASSVPIVMPLTNDSICGAVTLQVDGPTYIFSNLGATAQTGESQIAPPVTGAQTTTGWADNAITRSTWFKFAAPATGQIRVSGVDQGFNGQIAIYDAVNCSPIGALVLVAANDDEIGGASLAPNFTACGLTPGVEYFLMHDSFGATETGIYSIKMNSVSVDAGLSAAQIDACIGDTVDLFTGISGNEPNGTWSNNSGTQPILGASFVRTSNLATGIYTFQYNLVDGCARDSVTASFQVYPRSNAGMDGTITICKNEPTNLLAAISGLFDFGGTWFSPTLTPLSSSSIAAGALATANSFNYQYIVGNGICPNDTSIATVIVLDNCDYLAVDENSIKGLKVYPNPTNGVVNVQAEDLTEDLTLVLFDMNGKVIWSGEMLNTMSDVQIDLTNFERGVYILKMNNSLSTNVIRVVKN